MKHFFTVDQGLQTWAIATIRWAKSNWTENSGQLEILVGNTGFWLLKRYFDKCYQIKKKENIQKEICKESV